MSATEPSESPSAKAAGAGARLRGAGAAISAAFTFSNLTSRIVALNVVALGLLVAGALYLSQFRAGLIDLRIDSLRTQAQLIAVAIAEAAGEPEKQNYNRIFANEVLRRLALPTGLRAQLYDRRGRLTGDTRSLLQGPAAIEVVDTANENRRQDGLLGRIENLYDRLIHMTTPRPELYRETPPAGVSRDREVYIALAGDIASGERINSENELILSVAVPVARVKAVLGALVLSTEGGAIDEIVREERIAILEVFLAAFIASTLLSVALAQTIARPIQKLAQAADDTSDSERGPLDPTRISIPDYTYRGDEIGHLSGALRRMTSALYTRIDAIESFAADVAHEIKNPLTSLRSAVETMRLAKSPDAQERLLQVIEKDVGRLDRLVTDISNASRLDAELVRENRESFNLTELINIIAGVAEVQAEKRKVRLQVIPPEKTIEMNGMESRFAQVLHNVIDNGLSFSPAGGALTISSQLTPRSEKRSDRNGAQDVLIIIEDEGPGIPPENVESIFERFYSERPDTEEFGNHSGLGLNICRQIVEAHGGKVWAENRTDRSGARFIIRAPQ